MTAVKLRPARITWRDDSLPHQIRLVFTYPESPHSPQVQMIAVSCTCMATGHSGKSGPSYRPLEARTRWDDPGEPLRIWHQHMDEVSA
jgi:hypothetical protein